MSTLSNRTILLAALLALGSLLAMAAGLAEMPLREAGDFNLLAYLMGQIEFERPPMAVSGEPIDLTPPYTADASGTDPDISSGAQYKTTVSYADKNQYTADVPWTIEWVGQSNGDNLLEEGEMAEITAWLLARNTAVAVTNTAATGYWTADANGAHGILSSGTLLGVNDQFTLEVKPPSGAVLSVQRTLPARLDTVMDLK